jgi:hypothetical protein
MNEFDRDGSAEERGERSLPRARCCQQHALEWGETTEHLENDVPIDDLGHRLPDSWCLCDAQEEANHKVDEPGDDRPRRGGSAAGFLLAFLLGREPVSLGERAEHAT